MRSLRSRRSSQLALDLRDSPRWGGRRARAGRKPGPNPRVRHERREKFPSRHPCHVTLKVRRGVPSLRSARLLAELQASFAKACERGEFRLVHYSVQNDHVHMIVEAKSREALGRGMKSIGARFARAVNRVFGRTGRVLADVYHLVVLRTPRQVRNALAYVLLNGRRHAAKRGKNRPAPPRVDPGSSGSWFWGWRRGSKLEPRPGPSPGGARPHLAPTGRLAAAWPVGPPRGPGPLAPRGSRPPRPPNPLPSKPEGTAPGGQAVATGCGLRPSPPPRSRSSAPGSSGGRWRRWRWSRSCRRRPCRP